MFQGYSDETVDFLWGIRFNNERGWFMEHKEQYLRSLQRPTAELAREVYDRFLEKSCALRVGVCHDEALMNRIPSEEHDSVMDAVITPQETIWLDRHRRNGHG